MYFIIIIALHGSEDKGKYGCEDVRCKVCSTHCSSVLAEISSERVERRGKRDPKVQSQHIAGRTGLGTTQHCHS